MLFSVEPMNNILCVHPFLCKNALFEIGYISLLSCCGCGVPRQTCMAKEIDVVLLATFLETKKAAG